MPRSGLTHPRFLDEVRKSAVANAGGFPDHVTITRPASAGAGASSAGGGSWTPAAASTVYEGCCRIQLDTYSQGRAVTVGDDVVTLHRYRVGLPWDVPEILVDDIATITCTNDPVLQDRPVIVRDFVIDTYLVRRSVLVEDHPALPTPE